MVTIVYSQVQVSPSLEVSPTDKLTLRMAYTAICFIPN